MTNIVTTLLVGLAFLFSEGPAQEVVFGGVFLTAARIGPLSISIFDMLLLLCVYILLVGCLAKGRIGICRLPGIMASAAWSVVAFLLYLLANGAISIGHGSEMGKVLLQLRPFLWGTIVAVIVYSSDPHYVDRLIRSLIVVHAVLVLAVYTYQGGGVFLPAWEAGDSIIFSFGVLTGLLRLVMSRVTISDVAVMLSSLAILLGSSRRAPLVGLVLAALIAWVYLTLRQAVHRQGVGSIKLGRLFIAPLIVAACSGGLLLIAPAQLASTVYSRMAAVFENPDQAVSYRLVESHFALEAMGSMSASELAFGKGLGVNNPADVPYALGPNGQYDWYAIHNSWLQLILNAGLVGLFLFLNMWAWLAKVLVKPNPGALACALAVVVYLVGMTAGQWLWSVRTVVILGALIGAVLRNTAETSPINRELTVDIRSGTRLGSSAPS